MAQNHSVGRLNFIAIALGLVFFLVFPFIAEAIDEPFYIDFVARIMIFAIAAASLDLILGYGGMVSFGHAAYLGIGGYAVAIFSFYGIDNGFLQFAVAVLGSALVALGIGAVCLRTGGVYFIMITLAFTQMLYFLGISLEEYGGDDGVNTNRSEFVQALDLYDPVVFYYFVLVLLVLCVFLLLRIVNSRFGMVIRGSHTSDTRMRALGYPTYRYRLVAFVISGAMCGIAGFLLANATEFITPEYMHWSRSGEILIMVIMGGMGSVFGPLFGAAAYFILEEWLSSLTVHWLLFFGPSLLLLVLFFRGGLFGLLERPEASRG